MKKNLIILGAAILGATLSSGTAQADANTSSMVGASDMREAKILSVNQKADGGTQTCEVKSKKGNFSAMYEADKQTKVNGAIAREFQIHSLAPNTEYEYTIVKDGKVQSKGEFKTSPDYIERTSAPDFSFIAIGNQYTNEKDFDTPFRTNGGNYEIFEQIVKARPAFVIWGDNIDEARNADFGSDSGIKARYLNAFKQAALEKILSSNPNYFVMSQKTFAKSNEDCSSKNAKNASEAFRIFSASPRPVLDSVNAYSFSYSDAEFFVLDDCSNRSLLDYNQDTPKFLGDAQMKWLKNALQNSKSIFKFIVINSPAANPVKSSGHFIISKERDQLINFLSDKKIGGVVFISANKNYGEITRLVRAGAYPLFDITLPPVTGKPAKETDELNFFRVPSSGIFQRAFAKFTIDGAENARVLNVTFYSVENAKLFSLSISQSQLYKNE